MGNKQPDQEFKKLYRKYERWCEQWTGHRCRDDALGPLVRSRHGKWTFTKTVPLIRRRFEITLYDDSTIATIDYEQPPTPPVAAFGRLWTWFCSEWTHERWPECVGLLHRSARALGRGWTEHLDAYEDREQIARIERYCGSVDIFRRSLKPAEMNLMLGGGRKYVSIHFETDFDEEHGLGIHFLSKRKRPVCSLGGDGP